jgi:hypothetical protein
MADSRIIQRGIAKIETTGGSTNTPAVMDALVGVTMQTLKGKHNWESSVVKDFAGFEFGWSGRNAHIIITASFKLTAASYALAVANGSFLGEYAAVALSGFDLPWLNAAGVGGFYTGNWCYFEGGNIDLSNTEPGGGEIMLRKYKDPTQNAQQFVIPS